MIFFTHKINSFVFQFNINDFSLISNSTNGLRIYFEKNLSFKINHKIMVNPQLLVEIQDILEILLA